MFVIDLQSPHVEAVLTQWSPTERGILLGDLVCKPDDYAARWIVAVSVLVVDDAVRIMRSLLPRKGCIAGGPS